MVLITRKIEGHVGRPSGDSRKNNLGSIASVTDIRRRKTDLGRIQTAKTSVAPRRHSCDYRTKTRKESGLTGWYTMRAAHGKKGSIPHWKGEEKYSRTW